MLSQIVSLIERVDDSPATRPSKPRSQERDEDAENADGDAVGRTGHRPEARTTAEVRHDRTESRGETNRPTAASNAALDDTPEPPRGDNSRSDEPGGPAPVDTIAATTSAAMPDATAVVRLSKQVAAAESARRAAEVRSLAAESAYAELQSMCANKDAALKRLIAVLRETKSANTNISDDVTELSFEAEAALGGAADPVVLSLRHTLQQQARSLADVEEKLCDARARVVAIEAAAADAEAACEAHRAARETAEEGLRQLHHEYSLSKKETARLSAKQGMLRVTMEELETSKRTLQKELDIASSQLVRRDNELSLLRGGGGIGADGGRQTRELRDTALIAAVSRKGRAGQHAATLAATVDVVVLRFGRLLRSHALLRLVAVLYIAVLHIYVFNAVMVFLHHSSHMPDHMGDDVHDHIAHHIHPG